MHRDHLHQLQAEQHASHSDVIPVTNPLHSWQKKGKEEINRAERGGDSFFFLQQTGMLIHSNRPVSLPATECSAQVTGGNSRLLIGLLISSFVGQWGSSSATAVLPPTAHGLGNMCNPNQSTESGSRGEEWQRKLWQGRTQKFSHLRVNFCLRPSGCKILNFKKNYKSIWHLQQGMNYQHEKESLENHSIIVC